MAYTNRPQVPSRYLGAHRLYHKFVKDYSKIAALLTDLLKKDAFQLGEKAQKAFEELKTAMTTTPVLALPNFSQPFVIEKDASGKGAGAVLMEQGKPIAFHRQLLLKKAKRGSVYKRELMAIVFAK